MWFELGVAAAGLLVLFCLSPLETLRWWPSAGRDRTREVVAGPARDGNGDDLPDRFVVFLSGVGDVDPKSGVKEHEEWLLSAIEDELPGVRVVRDVFPYAVEQRDAVNAATGGFWSIAERLPSGARKLVRKAVLQSRNVGQALISADPRYGPAFHADLTRKVWKALREEGYRQGSGVPVTILGYSGGAQMGLGVSWLLALLHVECSVIGLGGVYTDDRGFSTIEHFTDIRGTSDPLWWSGPIVSPGRWPINVWSTYRMARRAGRVTKVTLEGVQHHSGGGYFDRDSHVPDGRTHAEASRDAVVEALR